MQLRGRAKMQRLSALRQDWRRKKAKKQNGMCALCGKPMGNDVTLDHVVPLALGGEDHWENVQAAHGGCNRTKGDGLTIAASKTG